MLELWLAFITGFLSSMHCVGMCGPIVMGCIASQKPVHISLTSGDVIAGQRAGMIMPHLLYNGGRVISYSMVGLAAGLIGAGAIFSESLQSGFSIALGAVMILMALFQMNLFPKNLFAKKRNGVIDRMISDIVHSAAPEARLLIGLLTPLLPCGLLYGMAVHAAATSSPVTGGLEMAAFATGAVPALLLAGLLSRILSARIRKLGTTFAAIVLIVMGSLTIGRGAGFYKGGELFHSEKEPCCQAPQKISR